MKQIYGIDLSKDKFDVNFIGNNEKSVKFEVKNEFHKIIAFLEDLPEKAVICAEYTGVYGDMLLFLTSCMNIPLALATGYEIKHSLGLIKGKSDPIDAARIREYGERFFDKLKFVKYPDQAQIELRELYQLRVQLVEERKKLITQGKGKNHKPYQSIKTHCITKSVLDTLEKAIKEIEQEITNVIMSEPDLKSNYLLIQGIKGIGHITSCDLIIKTGNFKEINTARKAASYAGVCPFPYSSGKMVKKSRVSHMADKELKKLLYLCSEAAKRSNPEYVLYYERKKLEGKHHYLIMNNISNKLLRTIFSMITTRKEYSLGHFTNDPRQVKNTA